MATDLSSFEQHATPPSWSHLDQILHDRLGWLHHLLSCGMLSAVEAAVQFSNIMADLLLEYGLVVYHTRISYRTRMVHGMTVRVWYGYLYHMRMALL